MNINVTYKHSYKELLILAGTYNRDTLFAKCTCGFSSDNFDRKLKVCPDCGVEPYKTITTHTRDYNVNHISGYNLNTEKAVINHRKLEIIYRSEDDGKEELLIDKVFTDFVIEYEQNKKGTLSFKPKRIVNGITYKLLKNEIVRQYYSEGDTDKEVISLLKHYSGSYYNEGLGDIIWGLHNKYKYCYDAIKKGILEGFDSEISGLKEWNNFILKKDDKEITYIKEMIKRDYEQNIGLTRRVNLYSIKRDYNVLQKKLKNNDELFKYLDTLKYVYDNKAILEENTQTSLRSNDDSFASMIYDLGFTIEEIIELFNHANRQAFNLSFNLSSLLNGYVLYKKIGIPIDKKPRELAIFFNKTKELIKACTGSYKISYKIESTNNTIYFKKDKYTIETVYKLFGFKALDKILVSMNFDNIEPYVLIDNDNPNDMLSDLIFFIQTKRSYNNETSTIKAILTPDGELIENVNNIEELIEKQKEAVVC